MNDGIVCIRGSERLYKPVLAVVNAMRSPRGVSVFSIHGVEEEYIQTAHVTMELDTIDVNTGERTRLSTGGNVNPFGSRFEIATEVGALVHTMITHEIDEWLALDGHQLDNPHERNRP